ncbi:hypothetical protein [Caulobacter sp. 1776]|uniref:hypothetical protein n=1 Tax=Caulobacter sp. 1776 TaxID=3156420 RepID=UPI00339ACE4A
MADGHFPDVELLRRELAALILEWAGKAVKDDPDGPMSTALIRAVGEAARDAVAEQHQILTADAADRIAEALERRGDARGGLSWRVSPLGLGVIAVAVAALLAVAFLLGLRAGRTEGALPATPAAATAPIAPLAPAADEPAQPSSPPPATAPRAAARPQTAAPPAAKRVSRPTPRELGRPAPAGGEPASGSTQPVGAATPTPTSSTPVTKP